jgi:hypothetical protein
MNRKFNVLLLTNLIAMKQKLFLSKILKTIIATMLLTICCNLLKAQNLIRNGDFEQGYPVSTAFFTQTINYNCSVNSDSVEGLNYWYPDLVPAKFVYGSPFFNCYDNILGHSGISRIAFNANDGAHTTLINPLQIGHTYKLQYYVCLDSMWFFIDSTQGYPNKTWIIFSFNNGGNVFNSPQITFTGKGDWKKYDTIFTAKTNSSIFYFHGNNEINPLSIYIDDISLEKDMSIDEDNLQDNPSLIYYEQNINSIRGHFKNALSAQIKTFNLTGQFIAETQMNNEKDFKLNLKLQSNGLYIISIQTKNSVMTKKIILNKNF